MRSTMRHRLATVVLFVFTLGLMGCVDRTIEITSEPPGALVYLNDLEVGRTPCEVQFLYYGTYDIRLVRDGYEPWIGPADARAPLYDLPGPDLVAELLPLRFQSRIKWHFDLQPVDADPAAMSDRARELRERLPNPDDEPETKTETPAGQ